MVKETFPCIRIQLFFSLGLNLCRVTLAELSLEVLSIMVWVVVCYEALKFIFVVVKA
jgi:hypothetical protein